MPSYMFAAFAVPEAPMEMPNDMSIAADKAINFFMNTSLVIVVLRSE